MALGLATGSTHGSQRNPKAMAVVVSSRKTSGTPTRPGPATKTPRGARTKRLHWWASSSRSMDSSLLALIIRASAVLGTLGDELLAWALDETETAI
ncbi:hypothetical protein NFJ02_04g115950 [Pycnococcus provasolii]